MAQNKIVYRRSSTMTEKLKSWYERHKRDLPWRNTSDPYKIWVSEIILQQTRVDQGLDYYYRFIERFPDVGTLARASENDVLVLWQGLGYYSRARNMHAAARQILLTFGGKFPGNYNELLRLKGVGPYTAAAIASFAFGEAKPAIDGNVNRVISRLFLVEQAVNKSPGQRAIEQISGQIIPHSDPATYNQAMMEFGALQCVPVNPDCDICPLKNECLALKEGMVNALPVKVKKKAPKARYLNYLVIEDEDSGRVILTKRQNQKDIWYNLYEFPLVESDQELDAEQLTAGGEIEKWLGHSKFSLKSEPVHKKHQLSHQTLHAYFWRIKTKTKFLTGKYDETVVNYADSLEDYPLPRLISAFAEENLINY